MPSLVEIIDRAEQIAVGRGVDPHQSPVIDGQMTFEALVPHALRYEIQRRLAKSEDLQDLNQSHVIAIAAGVGALPKEVLKRGLKTATLTARKYASLVPYERYLGYKYDAQLDYFSIVGNTIYFKEAGTTSYTGNITLNTPSIPRLNSVLVNYSDLNTGTDRITAAYHPFQKFDEVNISSIGTAPSFTALGSPIAPTTKGYIIVVDGSTIQIASSIANAHTSTADDITSAGTAQHTVSNTLLAAESVVDNLIALLASVMTGEMKVAELLAV